MIEKNYESILNKSNTRSPQKENKISYCSIRKPEDGLINWSWKNTDIHNFIRAQSDPYPGAFTYINGEKYFLSDSTVIKYPYYGPSGVIAEKNSKYIIVCCGENALKIKNIKKYTSNENIINKMRFGKKFEW
jgi:methionyl-tRNA formyltransferase